MKFSDSDSGKAVSSKIKLVFAQSELLHFHCRIYNAVDREPNFTLLLLQIIFDPLVGKLCWENSTSTYNKDGDNNINYNRHHNQQYQSESQHYLAEYTCFVDGWKSRKIISWTNQTGFWLERQSGEPGEKKEMFSEPSREPTNSSHVLHRIPLTLVKGSSLWTERTRLESRNGHFGITSRTLWRSSTCYVLSPYLEVFPI